MFFGGGGCGGEGLGGFGVLKDGGEEGGGFLEIEVGAEGV